MITGGCLCGRVRFEVDDVIALTHCHCTICRKLSGAAFATYAHVAPTKFRLITGESAIDQHESSPGSQRRFCRFCGSPAPGMAAYLTVISIPAGLLDDDPGVRPILHTFVDSKAPWWKIDDGLKQYGRWVPGYEPKTK
jgi:hypothetical protein